MKYSIPLLTSILLAGVFALSGCGKQEEQPTRFNKTLGGTPVGVPVGQPRIDPGILQDPANYAPAKYDPLELGILPGGGPEAEAIRTVVKNLVLSVSESDFPAILDACVPEQVAPLNEYLDSFEETRTVMERFNAVCKEKLPESELAELKQAGEAIIQLADTLSSGMAVSVTDEENAIATFDFAKIELPESARDGIAQLTELGASVGQLGATGLPPTGVAAPPAGAPPAGEANAPAPAAAGSEGAPPALETAAVLPALGEVKISLPFRKVDDQWRMALPFAISEELAEVINEGFVLLKDFLADMTESLEGAETVDEQTFTQIVSRLQLRYIGPAMGWFGQFQMALASLEEMEAEGADAPPAPEEKPVEEENPEPEKKDRDPNKG